MGDVVSPDFIHNIVLFNSQEVHSSSNAVHIQSMTFLTQASSKITFRLFLLIIKKYIYIYIKKKLLQLLN